MAICADVEKAISDCEGKTSPIKGIVMSPEAFVELRNELFLNVGTVITNQYQEYNITVVTAMIGRKDWFIDTAD